MIPCKTEVIGSLIAKLIIKSGPLKAYADHATKLNFTEQC